MLNPYPKELESLPEEMLNHIVAQTALMFYKNGSKKIYFDVTAASLPAIDPAHHGFSASLGMALDELFRRSEL